MRVLKLVAFACSISALAGPALATPATPRPDQAGASVKAFVQYLRQLDSKGTVKKVTYADMDDNGRNEALVLFNTPCHGSACQWDLVADMLGKPTIVATGEGEDVQFRKTEGHGSVIVSDGIIWAFNGTSIYPFDDILSGLRPFPADKKEIFEITSQSQYKDTSKMSVSVYVVNLLDNGFAQKVALIGGLYYSVGTWGTPYLILDHTGKLLTSGVSMDHPRLFHAPGGNGVKIVDVVPAGYRMSTLSAASPQAKD